MDETGIEKLESDTDEHNDDLDDDKWLYTSGIAANALFEGSSLTVLQALVKYFSWFCEHPSISKTALSSMLTMQKSMLPPDNSLPASYEAALSAIEPYLVQPVVYDVCKNDCIIYRNEHASLSSCPKCGSGRYISEQSKFAVRRFTYLPLKPRLQRLFGTHNMAQILQTHCVVQDTDDDDDTIYDIHQSEAWRKAYSKEGIFKEDHRGISLALCTDGVNPFAHNKISYSMWPIMLTLLNLPRNKYASIILVGIVPSNGAQEPHSLNPYLDILVDELLELSSCKFYDAYRNAPFECKVAVLLYILDYPGMCKTLSVVGSGGLKGCMFCDIRGDRNQYLDKTVYLQNRRFVSPESRLRNDKER